MWKATIRGVLARKVRLALTAVAVLLGVSFVSATYVLTDTVKQSFDAVYNSATSYDVTLRIGAYILAIEKVAKTLKIRGIYA